MSGEPPNEDLSGWADALEAAIAATPPPRAIDRVAVVRETASTQDAARAMAGDRPGLLVVAGRQTGGRGRLGRAWHDAPEASLAMTFVLDAGAFESGRVALAAGLAACLAAEAAGAPDVALRWPNDVVERVGGRKLAGVLVERSDDLLLVGVGMNIAHGAGDWPERLRPRAVSLAQLGAGVSRLDAARLMLDSVERALALAPHELAEQWGRRDTLVGTRRTFRHDGRDIPGLVRSIEPASGIVVATDDGGELTLPAHSTSLVHDEPAPGSSPGGAEMRPLDPRHVVVERIGWLIFAAIVLVPGVLATALDLVLGWWRPWVAPVVGAGVLAATLIILWAAWRWPPLEYRATRYRVGPAGIEIRRGVYWRKVINVPRSRVQHTDVTQGPLSRRYGLATLTVHTAGTQNAAVALSGLGHADALAARDVLTSSEGDDGL